ncbi:MAG: c-type cytochrome [Chloroflexi bacterium]|nr:c-type cytochrome [Chloroflexota bacterium]
MGRETLARIALACIVIGLPLAAYGYETQLRDAHNNVIEIQASVSEQGGFSPDVVRIAVDTEITLRFSSTDVTHGIAIGPGWDINVGHVDPGKVEEITLTFDEPGTYTYYCTTFCSADHWRMRGVITVYDPENPDYVPPPYRDPVMFKLVEEGVNIDAVHTGDAMQDMELVFTREPSLENGEQLAASVTIPAEIQEQDWRRTHTPLGALHLLERANPDQSQADLIDVVLYLWTPTQSLPQAESYYNSNCTACHGQYGGGDGPISGITAENPVAFNDLGYMFQMRGDVLYAKLRRGGMGTDMPNFGTLLTPEETWLVVDYLWTLPTRSDEPSNPASIIP